MTNFLYVDPKVAKQVATMRRKARKHHNRKVFNAVCDYICESVTPLDRLLLPLAALIYFIVLLPMLIVRPGRTLVILYLHMQDSLNNLEKSHPDSYAMLTYLSRIETMRKNAKQ
jgi:hypothetical protein